VRTGSIGVTEKLIIIKVVIPIFLTGHTIVEVIIQNGVSSAESSAFYWGNTSICQTLFAGVKEFIGRGMTQDSLIVTKVFVTARAAHFDYFLILAANSAAMSAALSPASKTQKKNMFSEFLFSRIGDWYTTENMFTSSS
jgi:hypothetical protein